MRAWLETSRETRKRASTLYVKKNICNGKQINQNEKETKNKKSKKTHKNSNKCKTQECKQREDHGISIEAKMSTES